MATDVGQAELLGRRLSDIAAVFGISEQKLKLFFFLNQLFYYSDIYMSSYICFYFMS